MKTVIHVVLRNDFSLELWFDTGGHRLFDARSYLDRGVFTRLQDIAIALFKQVLVVLDTMCWPGNLDIATETFYDRSVLINADLPLGNPLPSKGC
jgi:hypothetical protein